MKTVNEWYLFGCEQAKQLRTKTYDERKPAAIAMVTKIQLDAFKAGMLHAASLNIRCMPDELDGVDLLKREILKAAKQLKELP